MLCMVPHRWCLNKQIHVNNDKVFYIAKDGANICAPTYVA